MSPLNIFCPRLCVLAVTLWSAYPTLAREDSNAIAEASAKPSSSDDASIYASLWDQTHFYSNKENPILQDLRLIGRYQGQYHWSESARSNDDGWDERRVRLGLEAQLFHRLKLKGEIVAGPDLFPLYDGFAELKAEWKLTNTFVFSIGQQQHRFTHDRNTSSRFINYVERSLLTDQFALNFSPAVSIKGSIGKFNYYASLFSNYTDPNMGRAFTTFDAGHSIMLGVGYDLASTLGLDQADWRLDYLNSQSNQKSTLLNGFQEGLATSLAMRDDDASLVTELTYGGNASKGNVFGVNIQPGYFITDKLQVVARYQWAVSNSISGIKARHYYERAVDLNSGSAYQAAYVGLNYYIYGHRLKWMNGVEYSNLSGMSQWTALSALRISWGPESPGPFPTAYPQAGH